MSEKLKRCEACNEPFRWDVDVVIADDELYHKDCVDLYPTGYVVFLNGDFVGEIENDGQSAYEILEDEELVEVPE